MRRFELLVTPDVAADMVSRPSPHQRQLSPGTVKEYASAMREGRWVSTPQPIIFAHDRTLIDGNHRLNAVISSGVAIRFLIVEDADPDTFAYIDIGRRRTAAQFAKGKHGPTQTQAARLLYAHAKTDGTYRNAQDLMRRLSIRDTLAILDDHPMIGDAATLANLVHTQTRIHAGTHAALLTIVAEQGLVHNVDPWIDGLMTGAGLEMYDPRLALREKWLREYKRLNSTSHGYEVTRWSLIVKAWNAWFLGKDVRSLRYASLEGVPMIHDSVPWKP